MSGTGATILPCSCVEGLNYLTGAADGIFGQQTRRAVERFSILQQADSGRYCCPKINKLYNDPNVVIAPVEPEDARAHRNAQTADRYRARAVNYFNNAGELLTSELLTLQTRALPIYANPAKVPTGYTLTSISVTVTVSANGVASPSSVSFTYRAPATPTDQPIAVNVPVYYAPRTTPADHNPSALLRGQTTVIYAQSIQCSCGVYLVSAGSFSVSVSAAGIATPTSVTFTYEAPAPVEAAVPCTIRIRALSSTAPWFTWRQQQHHHCNDSLGTRLYPAGHGRLPSACRLRRRHAACCLPQGAAGFATARVTAYYKDQAGKKTTGNMSNLLPQGANSITANDSSVPASVYTLSVSATYPLWYPKTAQRRPPPSPLCTKRRSAP